ncbi:MAG: DUF3084 domain-containing protein [Negativicutes bacterium]|jgi:uncharacterized protein (DUF3084 family)
MYGIILIAVVALMGGAIAYIGDKLGSKVGKKKLSIFGLRPKHTSIVVTIITGILIAACTLGILNLVSRDVRTALFGMDELKAKLVSLSQEVTAKNTELETSRKELEEKTKEYSTLNEKVQATVTKLSAISRELAVVTAERDRTVSALAAARGDLDEAEQEITALQATKTQLDSRINQLNEAKTSLENDVDQLNKLTENLKQGLQFVREGAVVFRAGEVLYTDTLHSGSNTAEIQKAFTGIVYNANQIIIHKLGIENKDLEVLWIAKADFDQAMDIIKGNPGADIIVRISSASNTVYGEPVMGQIQLFPNNLIYAKDSIVYSEVVDVGRETHQAEEAILAFLQKVNVAAVKQGILPDPIQGTVGSMSGAQLYGTINKATRYGGKVELTATARTDVHTVGPLNIEINVEKVR